MAKTQTRKATAPKATAAAAPADAATDAPAPAPKAAPKAAQYRALENVPSRMLDASDDSGRRIERGTVFHADDATAADYLVSIGYAEKA